MLARCSFALLLSTALAACDGGADPGDRLERADVTDLPPGDGTGSAASGTYELDLYTTDCFGQCPVIHAGIFTVTLCDVGELDTATVDVTQTDGALVMDASGLVLDRLAGGIDAAGTFTVGAWGTEQGGDVEVLVRSTGTVDGDQLTGTAASRGHGIIEGQRVDCTAIYDVTGTRAD